MKLCMSDDMIKLSNKNECTACSACKNICPKNAISFITDEKGFNYYSVNEKLCINCGLCEKVCPLNNDNKLSVNKTTQCYAAWNKNNEVREKSSSGGVFSAVADYVLDNGGYVIGACLDEDNIVKHIIIENKDYLHKLRKAKYVQSDISDIFRGIKVLLNKGKYVLFSGTPCQVNGLNNYLLSKYDNLITIDFICHGVTNQNIFDLYIKSIETMYNSHLLSFDFRDKSTGWENYSTVSVLKNGKICKKNKNDDEYMKGYLNYSLFLRPSCTHCKFKGANRSSDITLGDFWGIKNVLSNNNVDNGVSALIINTKKGKSLFNCISGNIDYYKVKLDDIVINNPSYEVSTTMGKYSNYFFKNIDKVDFIDLIHKIDEKAVWDRNDLTIQDRIYLLKQKILK